MKKGTHKNVSLLGFQDRANQNDFLNACDIGIVTLSDGMYGLGVPSKSDNPKMLARMIEHIYSNRTCLSAMQNNAKTVADTVFAKERILEKYYRLLS